VLYDRAKVFTAHRKNAVLGAVREGDLVIDVLSKKVVKIMRFLKNCWDLLLKLERAVMIFACLGITALVFLSVMMRYVFKINYVGLEEITIMVAFWVYFIGAAYCSYDESHISADLMTNFIPEGKFKRFFIAVRSAVTAYLFIMAAYYSFDLIQYAIESDTRTVSLKMPLEYMYISICIGLCLMAFYSVIHMVKYFRKAFNPGEEALN